MARPTQSHPTPAELEVMHVIWSEGPCTVRTVLEQLNRKSERAYTTVMTLMNIMVDKGYLTRTRKGRAYIYHAKIRRQRALSHMLGDLLRRAFDGSSSALVEQLLAEAKPDDHELAAIRRAINSYSRES